MSFLTTPINLSLYNLSFEVSTRGLGNTTKKKRSLGQDLERDTISEATVTLRTVVTFVTWLISRTEFLV